MPANLESPPDGTGGKRPTTVVPKAPSASSPAVKAAMQGNRKRDTRPELALRSELHRRGLRYRVDQKPLKGLRCKADIVFRRQKVAVFMDGCFWHGCPDHGTSPKTNVSYWSAKLARNMERDRFNNAALGEAGWAVVRVWEHETSADAAERIARILAR
ncbi:MAG TPA: very short patch repair endonuclease [Solirubrobacterales bacterium]|jgi:DNA mismatch endonuclease (patch repair protein)|nr:very short patch repair endonuclease [Solirubrobacterales bacterium]